MERCLSPNLAKRFQHGIKWLKTLLAGGYVSRCVWKTKDEGIDRQEEERLEEGAVKPESRARAVEGGRRSKTATSDCAPLWRIGQLLRATAINRSPPGNCPRTYPASGPDPRRKLFRYYGDDVPPWVPDHNNIIDAVSDFAF